MSIDTIIMGKVRSHLRKGDYLAALVELDSGVSNHTIPPTFAVKKLQRECYWEGLQQQLQTAEGLIGTGNYDTARDALKLAKEYLTRSIPPRKMSIQPWKEQEERYFLLRKNIFPQYAQLKLQEAERCLLSDDPSVSIHIIEAKLHLIELESQEARQGIPNSGIPELTQQEIARIRAEAERKYQ